MGKYLTTASFLALALIWLPLGPVAYSQDNTEQGIKYAQELSSVFAKIAEKITPSVVNISASQKATKPHKDERRRLPNDPFFDPFREFFGEDFMERFAPPNNRRRGRQFEGLGTGVIVDQKGHILTNNHVLGNSEDVELKVRFHDDHELYDAKVVGRDPRTDLAVIKIDPDDVGSLVPASLGSSDDLRIGEWVIAAGNPFGLDNTITAGIVSAKGRSIIGGGQYEDFIQTDAAINPGNSGGPLVNLKGEVVGINTAIFSRSGGYMGIGFAIPITMARNVLESLVKEGRVIRGWLGVVIQNLTDELAESFEHQGEDGVLIGQVQNDSPADSAGLEQGDIVIEFDGEEITDVNQLRNLVAQIRPGQRVKVVVMRAGRKKSINVKIGELPDDDEMPAMADPSDDIDEEIGLSVEELTPSIASRLKTDLKKGVVVTQVLPGSMAQRASLQRGDIIVKINGNTIDSLEDYREAISEIDLSKGVRLLVETRGMQRFVFLRENG